LILALQNSMIKKYSKLYFFFCLSSLIFNLSPSYAQQESVTLAWSPNYEPDLSHYNLYSDTQPGTMVYLTSIPKSDTIYTDNQVVQGNTYYYKLTAVNIYDYESGPSNEVNIAVVNDPPVISQIPPQTIDEGKSFNTIKLDSCVSDPDNSITQLSWSFSGNNQLSVNIDGNHTATIGIPDPNWYGSETITFTATDPGNLSDSRNVIFTVTAENDTPYVKQSLLDINKPEDFSKAVVAEDLNQIFADIDNDPLYFSVVSRQNKVIPSLEGSTLSISSTLNFYGKDTIVVIASDNNDNSQVSDDFIVTVTPVNDAPQFVNLPASLDISGTQTHQLNLNEHVQDVDSPLESMSWSFSASHDSLKWQFDEETTTLTLWAGYYTGEVEFSCTVSDDKRATAHATFSIQIDNVVTMAEEVAELIPKKFQLEQNFPNPFNPNTKIHYHLPVPSQVVIEIYNITGQHMRTLFSGPKPAGIHDIEFNGRDFPSGLYFYRLQAGQYQQIRRMILTK
jgi:hypothetical protein